MDAKSFLLELRRRNVLRAAVLYIGAVWALTQGIAQLTPVVRRTAESDAALAELIRKFEKDVSYNMAYVFADRKEVDKAFEWLDKAQTYQDPGLSGIAVDPLFDNLRPDPRWLPLLRKLGKAPEQLDKIEFNVKLPADSLVADGGVGNKGT